MNYTKSYPKEFRNDKLIIEKKKCFFVMPFADKFNIVYAEIQQALLSKGYHPVRVDAVTGCTTIMNKILSEILTAQYIIVDISSLNPNVFYELGISHCYKEARNIVLIKDKTTKAPSDIRHISYIEYDRQNLILLKEQILKNLEDIKYLSELESTLNFHKIFSPKDDDSIITTLESYFIKGEIILMCNILNKDYGIKDSQRIETLINKFLSSIKNMFYNKLEMQQIQVAVSLIIKLLINSSDCSFASNKVNELLYTYELFEQGGDLIKFRTNIALEFAKEGKLINIVMPWIIEYFSQSKSTHIDLNRYKLEALLLQNKNSEIDYAIVNALFDSDRHIREHMADIVGEKCLIEGRSNLVIQLNREQNIYTAASLMEALGRIGHEEDICNIKRWVEFHYDEIANPGGNFVFKHARNAIASLDYSSTHSCMTEFVEKYKNHFYN